MNLSEPYEEDSKTINVFNHKLPFQISYAAPAIAASPALSYHPAPVARVAYAAPAIAKVRS